MRKADDLTLVPLISVIVPVYKVERYLPECMESLVNQSYQNLEIILVDDGSPDACPQLCDEYAAKDSRVVVVHKENGGLASARNAGLDVARGEYVAFVDSDDTIAPQTYAEMMAMALRENLDIVCCEISRVQCGKEIERYRFYPTGTVLSGDAVTKEILLDRIGSQVVKGLYKKTCWEGVRFPVGMLYEDIPVTFLAFAAAKQVGFIAKPFYFYRMNDTGISLSPNPIKPYHQFLGFRAHYDYAVRCFPEIANECCAKTAMYAISTCFHYYSERKAVLAPHVEETERFLTDHKKQIRRYKGYRKSRKLALTMFYFSRPLLKFACRILYKTGLQKAMHFDMK